MIHGIVDLQKYTVGGLKNNIYEQNRIRKQTRVS